MACLSDKNIFRLKPLIKNFSIKLSAYISDPSGIHTICLVGVDNTILFRTSKGCEIAKEWIPKSILWFKETNKCIQDVCFDPSGSMLLILCKFRNYIIIFIIYLPTQHPYLPIYVYCCI